MRPSAALATAAVLCLALAGCSTGSADDAAIAEPVVSFPTSTAAPATTKKAEAKEDKDKEEKTKETKAKSSAGKSTSKSTSKRKSTTKSSSAAAEPAQEPKEAAQAPAAAAAPAEVVTECAWPKQAEAGQGEEFQRFCDGTWARTTFPEDGDYVWKAQGTNWVSITPAGETESGEVCFNEADLRDAPEAVRKDLDLCPAEPAES